MSFALRATQRLFKSPVIPSTLDLLHCLSTQIVRLCNYLLTFSIRQFGYTLQDRQVPYASPNGSGTILSDSISNLLPTAFLRTGVAFGVTRVNPSSGLFRWTIAGAGLQETQLWVYCYTYPCMDAKPPILLCFQLHTVTGIEPVIPRQWRSQLPTLSAERSFRLCVHVKTQFLLCLQRHTVTLSSAGRCSDQLQHPGLLSKAFNAVVSLAITPTTRQRYYPICLCKHRFVISNYVTTITNSDRKVNLFVIFFHSQCTAPTVSLALSPCHLFRQGSAWLAKTRSSCMVSVERFELPTLWSQTRCATRLRYTELKFGWQGRTRTHNRLDQNQLHYHYATYQRGAGEENRTPVDALLVRC